MVSVPCPRCGKPVGLEEVICPHCRTPRDEMELEEGRDTVRQEARRLKRRPLLAGASLAAAALLGSVWFFRGLWVAPLGTAWKGFEAEVEKTRDPGHWIKEKPVEQLSGSVPEAEVAVSSFIFLPRLEPTSHQASYQSAEEAPAPMPVLTPPSAAQPPALEAPASPPQPGELRVQGTVFDLATAKPVGGVEIRFRATTNEARWETTTNAHGRYQISFYNHDSAPVQAMIEAPGYRKGLLEDRDPSYRERSPQSRKDLIAETTDSDLEPVPLRYKQGEQTVEVDLALIPQERK